MSTNSARVICMTSQRGPPQRLTKDKMLSLRQIRVYSQLVALSAESKQGKGYHKVNKILSILVQIRNMEKKGLSRESIISLISLNTIHAASMIANMATTSRRVTDIIVLSRSSQRLTEDKILSLRQIRVQSQLVMLSAESKQGKGYHKINKILSMQGVWQWWC